MRGFAAVALVNPKTRENVGSAIRAAGCYDAAMVVISGGRPERYMGRIKTDTHKSYRHIPTLRVNSVFDSVPYDCVPIAVELTDDARPRRRCQCECHAAAYICMDCCEGGVLPEDDDHYHKGYAPHCDSCTCEQM